MLEKHTKRGDLIRSPNDKFYGLQSTQLFHWTALWVQDIKRKISGFLHYD